jgi:hypothetical protein
LSISDDQRASREKNERLKHSLTQTAKSIMARQRSGLKFRETTERDYSKREEDRKRFAIHDRVISSADDPETVPKRYIGAVVGVAPNGNLMVRMNGKIKSFNPSKLTRLPATEP